MLTLTEVQNKIEKEIQYRIEDMKNKPVVNLYTPINYALERGGKRIRPSLLLMAYNLFKEDVGNVLPAAMAIEVFHNFTLLHDDIMDDADMRRGAPTVHNKFDNNAAILSGDGMAFLAYKYLSECQSFPNIKLAYNIFTDTALEVCEGQQYDMDFEERDDVSVDEYLEMIRLKTAVLLACSLKMGATLASASTEDCDALYNLGVNMGLAFQLQDDLLDVYGDPEKFGKEIGGDIISNKKTFLMLSALKLENEKGETNLSEWISKKEFDNDRKIKEVTEIYDRLEVKNLSEDRINSYFNDAFRSLSKISVDENNKKELKHLIEKMQNRTV